jgi:thioredoxin 1
MSGPANLKPFSGDYNTLRAIALKVNRVIVVDFHATWCGPCVRLGGILPQIATDNPNLVFLKSNIDDNKDLAAHYGVTSIPHLKVLKLNASGDLDELGSVVGCDIEKLKTLCKQVSS